MSFSILPYEIQHLLLETTASAPTTSPSAHTQTMLNLASTTRSLRIIFNRNEHTLLYTALVSQAGPNHCFGLELASRELLASPGSDNTESPNYELHLLRTALKNHQCIAMFAAYLEALSKTTVDYTWMYHNFSMEWWCRAVYLYAIYGNHRELYPLLSDGKGNFGGWCMAAYDIWTQLREDIITQTEAGPVYSASALEDLTDLFRWLCGFRSTRNATSNNIRKWRVMGGLMGVWEDATEIVKEALLPGKGMCLGSGWRFSKCGRLRKAMEGPNSAKYLAWLDKRKSKRLEIFNGWKDSERDTRLAEL